jgi:hypothetical protein
VQSTKYLRGGNEKMEFSYLLGFAHRVALYNIASTSCWKLSFDPTGAIFALELKGKNNDSFQRGLGVLLPRPGSA